MRFVFADRRKINFSIGFNSLYICNRLEEIINFKFLLMILDINAWILRRLKFKEFKSEKCLKLIYFGSIYSVNQTSKPIFISLNIYLSNYQF